MVLNTFQDTTLKPALPTLFTTGLPSRLSSALSPGGSAGAASVRTTLGTLATVPCSPLVCALVAVALETAAAWAPSPPGWLVGAGEVSGLSLPAVADEAA